MTDEHHIYAVSEHDREGESWPVPADHWFWSSDNRWVAVVADFHDDWWDGASPEDIEARPYQWKWPIEYTPTSGTLHYRTQDGTEITRLIQPGVTNHVMLGYACRIRRLTPEDVRMFKVDLGDAPLSHCVAVWGEDLGECLAAVVDMRSMRLVWSDADGEGTPIADSAFGAAVRVVLLSIFPHLSCLS